ncbi:siderophore-interacting FAD-binding domain protein [Bordetella holmesii 44057]|nr:siderophore-interacting FAD-binding domain protein [Bordetella holmesii ATCC 51541]AIT28463.1 siderophore-interacting FAD-binding domain protein [Bordetella holmesii 44057]
MTRPNLHVERVRHTLKLRQLTVSRVEHLAAGLLARITFSGEDLHDFVSASFDDHVKVFFPSVPGQAVVLPEVGTDGVRFAEGQPRPAARDYTPRHFNRDTGELVLDFVLHGEGPAGSWAAQAQVGQQLAIGGPRGSFVVPPEFDWHVLIGDETALPAIARRLEELPASTQALVLMEVPSHTNQLPLTSAARLQVRWLARDAGIRAWPTLPRRCNCPPEKAICGWPPSPPSPRRYVPAWSSSTASTKTASEPRATGSAAPWPCTNPTTIERGARRRPSIPGLLLARVFAYAL